MQVGDDEGLRFRQVKAAQRIADGGDAVDKDFLGAGGLACYDGAGAKPEAVHQGRFVFPVNVEGCPSPALPGTFSPY
jgi:hypothetical protein